MINIIGVFNAYEMLYGISHPLRADCIKKNKLVFLGWISDSYADNVHA